MLFLFQPYKDALSMTQRGGFSIKRTKTVYSQIHYWTFFSEKQEIPFCVITMCGRQMTYFTNISVMNLCVFPNRETLVEFFCGKFVVKPKPRST